MRFRDPDGHVNIRVCRCTSLPLAAIIESNPGVSQSINMVYHAPATVYACSPSLLYNAHPNYSPQRDAFADREHDSIRGHARFNCPWRSSSYTLVASRWTALNPHTDLGHQKRPPRRVGCAYQDAAVAAEALSAVSDCALHPSK